MLAPKDRKRAAELVAKYSANINEGHDRRYAQWMRVSKVASEMLEYSLEGTKAKVAEAAELKAKMRVWQRSLKVSGAKRRLKAYHGHNPIIGPPFMYNIAGTLNNNGLSTCVAYGPDARSGQSGGHLEGNGNFPIPGSGLPETVSGSCFNGVGNAFKAETNDLTQVSSDVVLNGQIWGGSLPGLGSLSALAELQLYVIGPGGFEVGWQDILVNEPGPYGAYSYQFGVNEFGDVGTLSSNISLNMQPEAGETYVVYVCTELFVNFTCIAIGDIDLYANANDMSWLPVEG